MSVGPLTGIRILEVGHVLAGPYATMLLADLGAEVTKLEPPEGDISRQVSDSYFASVNRGKRSIRLDLNDAAGQRELHELVAGAHALLTNLKPSGIRKLGLTYDALRKWNEKIVCVALTGFGLDGGDEPAFDYPIQAAAVTGFATMAGRTARRAEVLAVVTQALAADTADNWEKRLRRAGVPAAAVRDLANALAGADELLAEAGGYRLVGNPVRIDGYRPAYAGPPRLGEHGDLVEER
jgi:crotonobetainyl-CoA:carnitine CoA-transferase CaiB-like acyl-CoA transferase